VWPDIQIARVDHWLKNVFMLLGVAFAFFYVPERLAWDGARRLSCPCSPRASSHPTTTC
jgi:hypothetical protein